MGIKGLTLDKVYQASYVLKDVARKTDLIYSPHFSGKNQVYLKTENLQSVSSLLKMEIHHCSTAQELLSI